MDDLVKRLRKGIDRPATWVTDEIMDDAANRIEALEAEVARWRKAAEFWESCAALNEKKNEALEVQVRAADALAATCLDLSQQAYGYDHVYETTFHREVYEALHTALAAYRATKEGGE